MPADESLHCRPCGHADAPAGTAGSCGGGANSQAGARLVTFRGTGARPAPYGRACRVAGLRRASRQCAAQSRIVLVQAKLQRCHRQVVVGGLGVGGDDGVMALDRHSIMAISAKQDDDEDDVVKGPSLAYLNGRRMTRMPVPELLPTSKPRKQMLRGKKKGAEEDIGRQAVKKVLGAVRAQLRVAREENRKEREMKEATGELGEEERQGTFELKRVVEPGQMVTRYRREAVTVVSYYLTRAGVLERVLSDLLGYHGTFSAHDSKSNANTTEALATSIRDHTSKSKTSDLVSWSEIVDADSVAPSLTTSPKLEPERLQAHSTGDISVLSLAGDDSLMDDSGFEAFRVEDLHELVAPQWVEERVVLMGLTCMLPQAAVIRDILAEALDYYREEPYRNLAGDLSLEVCPDLLERFSLCIPEEIHGGILSVVDSIRSVCLMPDIADHLRGYFRGGLERGIVDAVLHHCYMRMRSAISQLADFYCPPSENKENTDNSPVSIADVSNSFEKIQLDIIKILPFHLRAEVATALSGVSPRNGHVFMPCHSFFRNYLFEAYETVLDVFAESEEMLPMLIYGNAAPAKRSKDSGDSASDSDFEGTMAQNTDGPRLPRIDSILYAGLAEQTKLRGRDPFRDRQAIRKAGMAPAALDSKLEDRFRRYGARPSVVDVGPIVAQRRKSRRESLSTAYRAAKIEDAGRSLEPIHSIKEERADGDMGNSSAESEDEMQEEHDSAKEKKVPRNKLTKDEIASILGPTAASLMGSSQVEEKYHPTLQDILNTDDQSEDADIDLIRQKAKRQKAIESGKEIEDVPLDRTDEVLDDVGRRAETPAFLKARGMLREKLPRKENDGLYSWLTLIPVMFSCDELSKISVEAGIVAQVSSWTVWYIMAVSWIMVINMIMNAVMGDGFSWENAIVFWSIGNHRSSEPHWTQLFLNLLVFLPLLGGNRLVHYYLRAVERAFDTQSSRLGRNFSVMVLNLRDDQKDINKLRRFFSSFGEIVRIVQPYNTKRVTKLHKKRQALIDKYENDIAKGRWAKRLCRCGLGWQFYKWLAGYKGTMSTFEKTNRELLWRACETMTKSQLKHVNHEGIPLKWLGGSSSGRRDSTVSVAESEYGVGSTYSDRANIPVYKDSSRCASVIVTFRHEDDARACMKAIGRGTTRRWADGAWKTIKERKGMSIISRCFPRVFTTSLKDTPSAPPPVEEPPSNEQESKGKSYHGINARKAWRNIGRLIALPLLVARDRSGQTGDGVTVIDEEAQPGAVEEQSRKDFTGVEKEGRDLSQEREAFDVVGRVPWVVKKAPEPEEVIWEGLEGVKRTKGELVLTMLIVVFILLLSQGIIAGLEAGIREVRDMSSNDEQIIYLRLLAAASGFVIFGTNVCIDMTVEIRSRAESHYSRSSMERAIFRRSSFFQLFNSTILVYALHYDYDNWYSVGGLAEVLFFFVLFDVVLSVTVPVAILTIPLFVSCLFGVCHACHERTARRIFKPLPMRMEWYYTRIIRHFALALGWGAMLPVIYPIVFLGLIVGDIGLKAALIRLTRKDKWGTGVTLAQKARHRMVWVIAFGLVNTALLFGLEMDLGTVNGVVTLALIVIMVGIFNLHMLIPLRTRFTAGLTVWPTKMVMKRNRALIKEMSTVYSLDNVEDLDDDLLGPDIDLDDIDAADTSKGRVYTHELGKYKCPGPVKLALSSKHGPDSQHIRPYIYAEFRRQVCAWLHHLEKN